MYLLLLFFFFFKQKTAYEMRISDWSSDVCSSDLHGRDAGMLPALPAPWRPRHQYGIDCGGEGAGELPALYHGQGGDPRPDTRRRARMGTIWDHRQRGMPRGGYGGGDRKSTRLNSSH